MTNTDGVNYNTSGTNARTPNRAGDGMQRIRSRIDSLSDRCRSGNISNRSPGNPAADTSNATDSAARSCPATPFRSGGEGINATPRVLGISVTP